VAARGRRFSRGIRRAPFQRLHRGPRNLRHGLAAARIDPLGADLPRDGDGHRAARGGARMKPATLAFVVVSGALFGFGLALSTMVKPEVVIAFLLWRDMGLLLVLGGAVAVTFVVYHLAPRILAKPWVGSEF